MWRSEASGRMPFAGNCFGPCVCVCLCVHVSKGERESEREMEESTRPWSSGTLALRRCQVDVSMCNIRIGML